MYPFLSMDDEVRRKQLTQLTVMLLGASTRARFIPIELIRRVSLSCGQMDSESFTS
jgi:hypothetical protein